MIKKIEDILENDVRPILLNHEGNVKILEYRDGILKIKLTGKCSGCPSANITTEEIIKKAIMDKFDEVKDVVLVNEVSSELIDMAKKILNHEILH